MSIMPEDPGAAGLWAKAERVSRGLSGEDLVARINGLAAEDGDTTRISQQVLSKFEQGRNKRKPAWARFVQRALDTADGETREDPYLSTGQTDDSVKITLLPNFVGLGAGGTAEGDPGVVSFSRDLIE